MFYSPLNIASMLHPVSHLIRTVGPVCCFLICWLPVVGLPTPTWSLSVPASTAADPAASQRPDPRPPERLLLQTDRQVYFPGETVYLTAFLLTEPDLTPATDALLHVELFGPERKQLQAPLLIVRDGKAQASLTLPEDAPPGQYVLRAWTQWQRNRTDRPPVSVALTVLPASLPFSWATIDLKNNRLAPGDTLRAAVQVHLREPTTKTFLRNIEAHLVAGLVAGNEVRQRQPLEFDRHHRAWLRMPVPRERLEGPVHLEIRDSQHRLLARRALPFKPQTLELDLFPESPPVNGLETRVGFRVRSAAGDWPEVAGLVVDQTGTVVARFRSEAPGLGQFRYTPAPFQQYQVRITRPAGLHQTFPLPRAANSGIVLETGEVRPNALPCTLRTSRAATVRLQLVMGGEVRVEKDLTLERGTETLAFPIAELPAGVASVVLLDASGTRLTTRRVFLHPRRQIRIAVTPDPDPVLPGAPLRLKIRTTDESGQPIPARFSLTVRDSAFLQTDRQQLASASHWAQMFLMHETAHTLPPVVRRLTPAHPRAAQLLDLALLTTPPPVPDAASTFHAPYPPEIPVLAGVVIDHKTGEPVPKAQLESTEPPIRVRTDENGRFVIPDLDLYAPVELEVSARGMHPATFRMTEYDPHLRLEINNEYYGATMQRPRSGPEQKPVSIPPLPPPPVDTVAAGPVLPGQYAEVYQTYPRALSGGPARAALSRDEALPVRDQVEAGKTHPPQPQNMETIRGQIEYPPELKQRGLQGRVVLRLSIDRQGQVSAHRVIRSPHPAFTRAVLEVLPELRYQPAQAGGKTVPGWVEVPFDFVQVSSPGATHAVGSPPYHRPQPFPGDNTPAEAAETIVWPVTFRPTLLASGPLETDRNGQAELTLRNAHALAGYHVEALATGAGRIGQAETGFRTRQPIALEILAPQALTPGDTATFFLKRYNHDRVPRQLTMQLRIDTALKLVEPVEDTLLIEPESGPQVLPLRVFARGGAAEDWTLQAALLSDGYRATVQCTGPFFPPGRVRQVRVAGQVHPGAVDAIEVNIPAPPESWAWGRVQVFPDRKAESLAAIRTARAYAPRHAADLLARLALESRLIQALEAHPTDVSALESARQQRDSLRQLWPAFLEQRGGLRQTLDGPAHEAWTALARALVQRHPALLPASAQKNLTNWADWLRKRRDRRGSFLGFYNQSEEQAWLGLTLAALQETETPGFGQERDAFVQTARQTQDPYLMALAAEALPAGTPARDSLKQWLEAHPAPGGGWSPRGPLVLPLDSVQAFVLTTARVLSVLAEDPALHPKLQPHLKTLYRHRARQGSWGCAYVNLQVLRMMERFSPEPAGLRACGLQVEVDGRQAVSLQTSGFRSGQPLEAPLRFPLAAGKHTVQIRDLSESRTMLYQMLLTWHELPSAPADSTSPSLDIRCVRTTLMEQQGAALDIRVKNPTVQAIPWPVLELRLPPGAEVDPSGLQRLQARLEAHALERIPGGWRLYLADLQPGETRTHTLGLRMTLPGRYRLPVSELHPRYSPARRFWGGGEAVFEIQPMR